MEQDRFSQSHPTRAVRAILPNGVDISVEASLVPNSGGEIANFEEVLSLEGVSKAINGLAAILRSAIDEVTPTKASLEFGLQIGLEPGKFVTIWVQGEAKANVKVKLEWSKGGHLGPQTGL